MNKKNISIITILLVILLSVGVGFNKLFSKEQKNDNNKSKTIISSNIENDESNNEEDESKEVEDSDKENENKEVEDSDKGNENKEVEKSEITSEEESNKNESENSTVINETTKPSDEATTRPNNTTIRPSDEVATKPSNEASTKPSNDKVEETTQPQPQNQTVTIAISCKTAINNGVNTQPGFTHLPSNGVILSTMEVEIKDGDTVFDVLVKATRQKGIHMEYTGSGSNIYIEGINNLYEFDGGRKSGWMYSVNGWYPNYGCGTYKLKANDVIEWNYTCDLGNDLGANMR